MKANLPVYLFAHLNSVVRAVTLLTATALLTGCPGPQSSPDGTGANAARTIVIRGSNTVGEELAPRLALEFKKAHPNVTIDMEFKGSAYGIGNLMGGYCDLAASSKPIAREQQTVATMRGVEFKENVIGHYAVAVIVNASNPVSNLTSSQVLGLFTGAISNWKDVGGPDAKVVAYIRDPVSGTHLGFKEMAMANGAYAENSVLLTNYQAIAESVAKDASGIGYVGLGSKLTSDAKPVSIDGTQPTTSNVQQGKYPYARALRIYSDARKEKELAKAFVDFTLSDKGQAIITEIGDVPSK